MSGWEIEVGVRGAAHHPLDSATAPARWGAVMARPRATAMIRFESILAIRSEVVPDERGERCRWVMEERKEEFVQQQMPRWARYVNG